MNKDTLDDIRGSERVVTIFKEPKGDEGPLVEINPQGYDLRDGLFLLTSLVQLCGDSIRFEFDGTNLSNAYGYGTWQQKIANVVVSELDEYILPFLDGPGQYSITWFPRCWLELN